MPKQAKLASTVAVLIGLRGRQWVDENLEALTTDEITTEADHQLCHLDVKVSPGDVLPSSHTVHTRTTVKLNAHPCKCPHGQQHQFEKTGVSKVPARRQMKDGALQQVHTHLIQELCLQFGLSSEVVPRLRSQPDSGATAPDNITTSRNEAIRRKEIGPQVFAGEDGRPDRALRSRLEHYSLIEDGSASNSESAQEHAYPTDAKEFEKTKRRQATNQSRKSKRLKSVMTTSEKT